MAALPTWYANAQTGVTQANIAARSRIPGFVSPWMEDSARQIVGNAAPEDFQQNFNNFLSGLPDQVNVPSLAGPSPFQIPVEQYMQSVRGPLMAGTANDARNWRAGNANLASARRPSGSTMSFGEQALLSAGRIGAEQTAVPAGLQYQGLQANDILERFGLNLGAANLRSSQRQGDIQSAMGLTGLQNQNINALLAFLQPQPGGGQDASRQWRPTSYPLGSTNFG